MINVFLIIGTNLECLIFRMSKSNNTGGANQGNQSEGYVNHALSGSGDSLNLNHSNNSHILRNSFANHQEIQGSSDFIRKYRSFVDFTIVHCTLLK